MKKKIVRISAREARSQEYRSGYQYPGKIVAVAEYRGKDKENSPIEVAASQGE